MKQEAGACSAPARRGGYGSHTEDVRPRLHQTASHPQVTDPEGELAKAGLADGDLVVAVNGKEFEGAMQMQVMLAGTMAKDEDARLTILRGGRTLEVSVNLKKVMLGGGSKAGGSVRPAVR